MDIVSILATVILITTLGPMVVGFGAYFAFKLRDKRKPNKKKTDETLDNKGEADPIFLTQYRPSPSISASTASSSSAASA